MWKKRLKWKLDSRLSDCESGTLVEWVKGQNHFITELCDLNNGNLCHKG